MTNEQVINLAREWFLLEDINSVGTEQIVGFAAAIREKALEEAARFIELGSFLHDQSPAKRFANEVAPKIRALKETK